MNLSVALALAVCLIGAIIYMLTTHPKVTQLAYVCFGCGLLAFLLTFSGSISLVAHN